MTHMNVVSEVILRAKLLPTKNAFTERIAFWLEEKKCIWMNRFLKALAGA